LPSHQVVGVRRQHPDVLIDKDVAMTARDRVMLRGDVDPPEGWGRSRALRPELVHGKTLPRRPRGLAIFVERATIR
jgi:hypothetical protein